MFGALIYSLGSLLKKKLVIEANNFAIMELIIIALRQHHIQKIKFKAFFI